MKKYVKSFPESVGYTNDVKSKYNNRLLVYATEGLKDLTLIAEKAPEELQSTIFTEKYLKLFFRAIFNMPAYLEKRKKDEIYKIPPKISDTRCRMLKSCNLALSEIGQRGNAVALAPHAWEIIKELPSSNQDYIYGSNAIQAIQIRRVISD